jgi:hypothetical protein
MEHMMTVDKIGFRCNMAISFPDHMTDRSSEHENKNNPSGLSRQIHLFMVSRATKNVSA